MAFGPYGGTEPLPRHLDGVTAEWLGTLLAHRYPGIRLETMPQLQLVNSHTTKLRVEVEYKSE